jgi:hypothetical protein
MKQKKAIDLLCSYQICYKSRKNYPEDIHLEEMSHTSHDNWLTYLCFHHFSRLHAGFVAAFLKVLTPVLKVPVFVSVSSILV